MDLINIDSRLKNLDKEDHVSASLIKNAIVSKEIIHLAPLSSTDQTATVRKWLTAQDDKLNLIIVAGTGEGNEVSALLNLMPQDCRMLLIERNPARAARFFQTCPVEKYVKDQKLNIAIGENTIHITKQFMTVMDIRNELKFKLFDSISIPPEDSDFYKTALLELRNIMRTKIFNIATLMKLGPQWQENSIKNLPKMVSSPGINALKNLFPGKPALIIAAGPSLNNALDVIEELAPHFVKICVAQALRPIRNAGIEPDLVMAVDAKPVTGEQFKTSCDNLFMACSSIVYPSATNKFKGIFSGHINANPIGLWISSFGEEKGDLFPGGTVTAGAIDLAVQMGCDPIITVGLDLSVAEDGSSHANNTMYDGTKLNTKELTSTPGNFRDVVFTRTDFRIYIDLIGNYISNHKENRFINANDSGAKIKGMEVISHEEMRNLAKGEVNAYSAISEAHSKFKKCDYKLIHEEIEKITKQMYAVEENATKGAMLCNRLIMLLQMPDSESETKANEMLNTLKSLDEDIRTARESSLLLDMSLRNAYFQVGKKQTDSENRYSPGVFANKESRTLYQEIAHAATWTRKLLSEIVEELNELEKKTTTTAQNLQQTSYCNSRKTA